MFYDKNFIIIKNVFKLAELKTEKQNRVLANEKAQKNASEVEQQNEIYRDKILELEDEKYKLQEQVEGIKNESKLWEKEGKRSLALFNVNEIPPLGVRSGPGPASHKTKSDSGGRRPLPTKWQLKLPA